MKKYLKFIIRYLVYPVVVLWVLFTYIAGVLIVEMLYVYIATASMKKLISLMMYII